MIGNSVHQINYQVSILLRGRKYFTLLIAKPSHTDRRSLKKKCEDSVQQIHFSLMLSIAPFHLPCIWMMKSPMRIYLDSLSGVQTVMSEVAAPAL